MFICKKCKDKKKEGKFSKFPISRGRCELCGIESDCYEQYLHDKIPNGKIKEFAYDWFKRGIMIYKSSPIINEEPIKKLFEKLWRKTK